MATGHRAGGEGEEGGMDVEDALDLIVGYDGTWDTTNVDGWYRLNLGEERAVAVGTALAALDAAEARARALEAAAGALSDWGRARRDEQVAIEQSRAVDHRGQAWFTRCVAGETRRDAEEALYEAWAALAGDGGAA